MVLVHGWVAPSCKFVVADDRSGRAGSGLPGVDPEDTDTSTAMPSTGFSRCSSAVVRGRTGRPRTRPRPGEDRSVAWAVAPKRRVRRPFPCRYRLPIRRAAWPEAVDRYQVGQIVPVVVTEVQREFALLKLPGPVLGRANRTDVADHHRHDGRMDDVIAEGDVVPVKVTFVNHAFFRLNVSYREVAVRERFRHLMVDESQDINPVQAELIERIAGGDGAGPRPALFLVGDARQSIYRFRGADVHRFTALQDLVARRGGPLLPLSRSFRSHDALVSRINELFGEVFAGTALDLAALPPMTGRPGEAPDDGPYLTLTQIGSRAPDGGRPREPERRRVEADVIAEEIERLLAGGRLVWDRDDREMRPARPGDIAILLRRFRHVHVFQQALDTHGITAATPSGTGFFTRQEVLDCLNLLRWLAEPQDDLALSGVLRSPFFALADDTLLALRGQRGRPLRTALADPPEEVAGEDRARCAHAAETLAELRRAAASLPADALLELALDRTAFEASWAPLAGGEQARANIRKLLRIVRTLAGHPLSEVVSYLEQRRDDLDPREGPATLDRPDAVQLMTVHGAKGLEFPIVFVPEAHLSSWSTWDAVRWSREDGVSVTLERDEDDDTRPRPGFYAHLQQRDQLEDAEEHRRLFYVAATRAGDYLHISGDESGRDGWLHAVRDAHADGALREIELREPVPPDLAAIARRRAPSALQLPATSEEQDYVPPLLARPRVIPLRASTPVTALRPPETDPQRYARGDGLAALRGLLVHRALEVSGGAPDSLDDAALADLAHEQSERALDDATARSLAGEVREMLDRFTRSPVAAALAAADVERWFELPFAWDWDGGGALESLR